MLLRLVSITSLLDTASGLSGMFWGYGILIAMVYDSVVYNHFLDDICSWIVLAPERPY